MNKQKVALIIPSLRHGGSERVISELANLWAQKDNLQVNLILLTNNQEECYKIHHKVNIIRPSKVYNKNITSKLFYKIWILFYIRNSCSICNVDTVLSFGERYNNIVLLSLLFSKIRVFVSDRNSPFMNIGFVQNQLRSFLYKTATGIIAQTNTAKHILFEKTKNLNIEIIPNPLKNILTKTKKREKIILNVGRNVFQKNQLELIEIFIKTNNFKEWKLKIVGSGPLKEKLKEKVKALKAEEYIYIIDFSANIDTFYNEASIFAFTSIREGFPNALIEAKAHGLACITYDCPTGPNELIKDGVNGYLIELRNVNKFVSKMDLLMASYSLRESFSLDKEYVKNKFSVETIGDNYLNFILKKDNEINNKHR